VPGTQQPKKVPFVMISAETGELAAVGQFGGNGWLLNCSAGRSRTLGATSSCLPYAKYLPPVVDLPRNFLTSVRHANGGQFPEFAPREPLCS
jgi:hypothetical protein